MLWTPGGGGGGGRGRGGAGGALYDTLVVGGQQLAPACHNAAQRAVLALPGRDIAFVRGRITPVQLGSHRPSYVNAVLIQSRGRTRAVRCTECRRRGLTPFPECRRLRGHFGGCCANCKWRDHGARCRFVDEDGDSYEDSESNDDASSSDGGPPAIEGGEEEPEVEEPEEEEEEVRRRPLLLGGLGTAGNPIVV